MTVAVSVATLPEAMVVTELLPEVTDNVVVVGLAACAGIASPLASNRTGNHSTPAVPRNCCDSNPNERALRLEASERHGNEGKKLTNLQ